MKKLLANLFILQKDDSYKGMIDPSNICAIIARDRDIAKVKFDAICKAGKYTEFRYSRYWISKGVEDYANHRHRRRSWGF
jgi:hypothetical protein